MIRVENSKCDLCGTCVGVCPVDCITLKEHELIVDHEICINCENCITICPVRALSNEK
jgi:Fe-S-cluster-containing hydrogenase component 2